MNRKIKAKVEWEEMVRVRYLKTTLRAMIVQKE